MTKGLAGHHIGTLPLLCVRLKTAYLLRNARVQLRMTTGMYTRTDFPEMVLEPKQDHPAYLEL